jgi:hypothetical protein
VAGVEFGPDQFWAGLGALMVAVAVGVAAELVWQQRVALEQQGMDICLGDVEEEDHGLLAALHLHLLEVLWEARTVVVVAEEDEAGDEE